MDRSLFFILFFLLFAPLACLDIENKQEEESVDYGAQVSYNDIIEPINLVAQEASPEDIAVGEYVYFQTTQQALGTAPLLVRERFQIIDARDDKESYLVFSGTQLQRDLIDGQWTEKTDPFELTVTKPLAQMASILQKPFSALSLSLNLSQDKAPPITYHNLSVTTKATPPPKKVSDAPNCLDIPGCTLRVTEIRFDQVIWETPITRLQHYWVVSADVPYLAFFYHNCVTGQLEMNGGQKTVLTQCTKTVNFRFTQ